MRQAIEEGFIMDVLQHYTTYDTYFRLARAGEEDPEVSVRAASKAIARYVMLHPSVVEQKAAIVVEHVHRSTRHRIGGRAKAMVVCRSRLSAVRFQLAIDAYAREHGYGDLGTLVAFSGTLNRIHPDKEETFVLDFVNDADEIQRAFAPYYDVSVAVPSDPNEVYDAWRELDRFGVVRSEDVEAFAREYFTGEGAQRRLYARLDPARDRFLELDEEDQEEFRTWLKRFVSRREATRSCWRRCRSWSSG
jgi:type I site-specific restriction-modification system R (restriction) subunit